MVVGSCFYEKRYKKTDTNECIAFITTQFDTFKADENKFLQKLVTCSENYLVLS